MQHLWFLGEKQTPIHESAGFAKKLAKMFMVLIALGFLLTPTEAMAQPFGSGMQTLRDALAGNIAAQTQLASDLIGTTPAVSVAQFLTNVRNAVAGGSLPGTLSVLDQAIAGNTASLATLQNALGGNSFFYYVDDGFGGPGFGITNCFDGTTGFTYYIPNCQANDLVNFIIAGTGSVGVQTMIAFLQGQAGAVSTINWLFNNFNVYLRDTLVNAMGGGSVPTAIANLQQVVLGDPFYLDIFMINVIDAFNQVGVIAPIDQLTLDWVNLTGPLIVAGPPTPGPPPGPIGSPAPTVPPPGPALPPGYTLAELTAILADLVTAGIIAAADVPGLIAAYFTPPPPPAPAPGPSPGPAWTPAPLPTFTIADPAPGPSSTCSTSSAPLTGNFATDPCTWTRDSGFAGNWSDNFYGDPFIEHQGGWQVVEFVAHWWNDEFGPALQNMATQLHASMIDQTRQIASMADTHDMTKSARQLQQRELEAKTRLAPNEKTCAPASALAAQPMGERSSTALKNALRNDLTKQTNAAPGTTAAISAGADAKERFGVFCDRFLDPTINAGRNGCPSSATPGSIPDGDIDVEGIMFRDTIDFSDEDLRVATTTMLRNLITTDVIDKLPPNADTTPEGREWILKQEHIKAIRNIATDAVTAIISRRMALPEAAAAGAMIPPPAPPYAGNVGDGSYLAFLEALGNRESSGRCDIRGGDDGDGDGKGNFLGKYQMGKGALFDAGCLANMGGGMDPTTWNFASSCQGYPVNSVSSYLANCDAQLAAVSAYHVVKYNSISACAKAQIGGYYNGVQITPSGLLAAGHLIGQGGVNCMLGCSGCSGSTSDAFGTNGSEYLTKFGGYEIPSDATSGSYTNMAGNPPDPRPVNEIIREIREKAGVSPERISDVPSYNEIMQALTKERFYDPDYFIRIANNLGALKQEQNIVGAYITIQLQDIYKLQEQINSLMGARASIKMNNNPLPSRVQDTPLQ